MTKKVALGFSGGNEKKLGTRTRMKQDVCGTCGQHAGIGNSGKGRGMYRSSLYQRSWRCECNGISAK